MECIDGNKAVDTAVREGWRSQTKSTKAAMIERASTHGVWKNKELGTDVWKNSI